ncbi:hypothetical protein [Crateriforma conspicua]|uniref:Uncharacterized protein n=1 Tax=Crateriforma conspicua TaxID=2527996 RepID=A0A5C5XZ61_9PLAN|nr:hypothetical protein [Crateriforma conspicua]TWT67781.1 hypothetical protein Pan14r_00180 [Crateriforma conspicua]
MDTRTRPDKRTDDTSDGNANVDAEIVATSFVDACRRDGYELRWLRRRTRIERTIGLTCSRLGNDPHRRRQVCQRLRRIMTDARNRNAAFVVSAGSAVLPWASRAAELFGASLGVLSPCVPPSPGETDRQSSPQRGNGKRLDRKRSDTTAGDRCLIQNCDAIDALYVRRGGSIQRFITQRLKLRPSPNVRIAVTGLADCASGPLIRGGAVGHWMYDQDVAGGDHPVSDRGWIHTDADWMQQSDRWLVHCTRPCTGAWPGQTSQQWMDDCLLSVDRDRSALGTLHRIITTRRLVASAVASSHQYPVVCFSAVSVSELMQRRTYRSHLRRWDYLPFGIAIRKSAALDCGIRPVVYGDPEQSSRLDEADRYRFQARGKTVDWTAEREFRASGDVDLDAFSASDLRVFVPDAESAAEIRRVCPWSISVVEPTMDSSEHGDR